MNSQEINMCKEVKCTKPRHTDGFVMVDDEPGYLEGYTHIYQLTWQWMHHNVNQNHVPVQKKNNDIVCIQSNDIHKFPKLWIHFIIF